MLKRWSLPLALLTVLALPVLAMASEGHPSIPGAELSAVWVIPFVCMLLSIAIMPLALPHIWHHHFGKISVFWGLAFLIPCLVVYGFNVAFYEFLHAILLEYIPFIVLLFALFTVAGGVRLKGSLVGTPVVNTGILAVGTILASWMGTTGAAMLLIRPLLRANAHRKYRVHSVVFFIFLVANIGGSLTPLGDPPLFLGYLKGVSFFWTTTNLFVKTCFMSLALLGIYFVLDTVLFGREGRPQPPHDPNKVEEKLGLDGSINLLFLLGIVLCVLVSGMVDFGEAINIHGVGIDGQNLLRDILLLCLAGLSWKFTTRQCRELNGFSWAPIEEVAKLFLGIFLSMIPALAILRAGTDGALAGVINMVFHDGEPAAGMVALPDFNPLLKRLNGKLGLSALWHYWQARGEMRGKYRMILFGIREEFRLLGLPLLLLDYMLEQARRHPEFCQVEGSWVLEDNMAVNDLIEDFSGRITKRYRLYRKEIVS